MLRRLRIWQHLPLFTHIYMTNNFHSIFCFVVPHLLNSEYRYCIIVETGDVLVSLLSLWLLVLSLLLRFWLQQSDPLKASLSKLCLFMIIYVNPFQRFQWFAPVTSIKCFFYNQQKRRKELCYAIGFKQSLHFHCVSCSSPFLEFKSVTLYRVNYFHLRF